MDVLPFVLLGRKVALQPDIGASAAELAFGTTLRIPGQILHDPGDLPDGPQLKDLLSQVRTSTAERVHQTSRHNPVEGTFKKIPEDITHVYTRQHQTKGLQTPYEGPFFIDSKPSASTLKLVVGHYRDGRERSEIRHLNDVKLADPDSLAAPASRPALGRPSAQSEGRNNTGLEVVQTPPVPDNRLIEVPNPTSTNGSKQTEPAEIQNKISDKTPEMSRLLESTARPVRATRNQNPSYVDSMEISGPPPYPGFVNHSRSWSASQAELAAINASIGTRSY